MFGKVDTLETYHVLSIQISIILIYKIIKSKISKKEVILPRGWRGRFLIFGGRCPSGLLTCGPMCQCFTKLIHVPHEAEQRQKQHVVKLKKMREKRIQQRVK